MEISPTIQLNFRALFFLGLALITFSVSAEAASETQVEIELYKVDPFLYGSCGWCTDLFTLRENDDRKDFYSYNLYTQAGHYEIRLKGPAGTTVTLFGGRDYSLKRGYLILVKKDDRPIDVGELEHLPPHQWVDVEKSDTESGIYQVWYHPSDRFKERIASVRWGQWWTKLPPASEKE